jgi:glycosyltransferase involved in cell wall biosynthesis
MSVTIIIPCLNEEGYITRILTDIVQQTVKPEAIFVVDCQSIDQTVQEAQTFKSKMPLTILQSPYRSAAAARNTGAKAAKTDYLLFIDADMMIPDDFVERLNDCTQKKQLDFVSPHFISEGKHPWDRFIVWTFNITTEIIYMRLMKRPAGIGGAMYIRKSLHDSIGGYDSSMREFDDLDYCRRLALVKPTYAYARRAIAIISNRRAVKQGRFNTFLQTLPDTYYLVRLIVRPLMKILKIEPKWNDPKS